MLVLAVGGLFGLAYVGLAVGGTSVLLLAPWFVAAGVAIGCVETAEHAAVAALAPVELRGSAFGLLAAVQSFGNLAASAIAGLLWTLASPRVASATWSPGWSWRWSGCCWLVEPVRQMCARADSEPPSALVRVLPRLDVVDVILGGYDLADGVSGRRDLQVCLSAVGVLCQRSPTSDGLATAWRSGQRRDVDLAGVA